MKTDSEGLKPEGADSPGHAALANRMAAHIEVMRVLTESDSLHELTPVILREISVALGFELAILWHVDGAELACQEVWHAESVHADNFIAKTRGVRLRAGMGLPGQVWESKEPVWVDETSSHSAAITPSAAKDNLHSAGCIPIKLKDEFLGAIEFISQSNQLPDTKIQELMLASVTQVGLFIERNRMAVELKHCEERYRILADLETSVLVTIDEDFDISFVNKAVAEVFGYVPSELIGKNLTLLIPEYHNQDLAFKQSVKTHTSASIEISGLRKNGAKLNLEVAFSKFQGTDGAYTNARKYATGVIHDITEKVRMQGALQETEQKLKSILSTNPSRMVIAEAPAMRGLIERVKKAAVSYAPILIQGETGSGKECIAHMIHHQSPLASRAFVARNCAAIPSSLFESEMFGHKKGSFTGADKDRKGAFLEADGGTLFLDEIGDLEYSVQTKLLRAIQERSILPVGGDKEIPVNPRIICATNKDLLECAKKKEFREDLYYRLVTVLLVVPPLRQRREDIIPLARHFIGLASAWTRTLSEEAEQLLLNYDWPGNVRELRSLMDQSVIFAAGNEIQKEELIFPMSGRKGNTPVRSLSNVERIHIQQILKDCGGNKTEAAKILGLARSTLVLKLKVYAEEGEGEKA